MSKIFNSFQCESAIYDFTISGGNLSAGLVIGIPLPRFCRVYYMCITPRVLPTSAGGLARFRVGWRETGVAVPTSDDQAFFPDFVAAAMTTLNVPVPNVLLTLTPVGFSTNQREVIFTTTIEALTAGKLQFDFWYVQSDF